MEASEDGPLLIETPEFPTEFKVIAKQGVTLLDDWRKITPAGKVLLFPLQS